MKHILSILLIASILSCSTAPGSTDLSSLDTYSQFIISFFDRYIEDLKRAETVVKKNDMIQNLSHLQRMNTGGKRYYLLEKRSLTALIQSITIEQYHDIILTDRGGRVLYTMHNDVLFNTVISRQDEDSPLSRCYQNAIKGKIFIHEPAEYSRLSSGILLFISYPVTIDNEPAGILIAVIKNDLLVASKPDDLLVLNHSGYLAVPTHLKNLGKRIIPEDVMPAEIQEKTTSSISYNNKNYQLSPVTYKNINWLITRKH